MTTLFFTFVGDGTPIPIKVNLTKVLVGTLKMMMKSEAPQTVSCDSHKLKLYLASKDNRWLSDDEALDISHTNCSAKQNQVINEANLMHPKTILSHYFSDSSIPAFEADRTHILVLIERNASGGISASWQEEIVSIKESISHLKLDLHQQLSALLQNHDSSSSSDALTNTARGTQAKEHCNKYGQFISIAPTPNSPPFWSEEVQIQANAIQSEAQLKAIITPYFDEILDELGLIYINSERYRWLKQYPGSPKYLDLKPDGFVTHRAMFKSKPPLTIVQEFCRPNHKCYYGIPHKKNYDCCILVESKKYISDDGFGQVVHYLEKLQTTEAAILFDHKSFWLISSKKGTITSVKIAKWAEEGSREVFKSFIDVNRSKWIDVLIKAMVSMNLSCKSGSSFLGSGAYGRVFIVVRGGIDYALKIVDKSNKITLQREARAIQDAAVTNITVQFVNYETFSDGAALLMTPVGQTLPRPKSPEEVEAIFDFLWQLHSRGIIHGDPRVPNVIIHENRYLWIDLMSVSHTTPALIHDDVKILTKSVFHKGPTYQLNAAVLELIVEYSHYPTQPNMKRIAQAVSRIKFE